VGEEFDGVVEPGVGAGEVVGGEQGRCLRQELGQ
jgi:hypothetical protein